MKKLIIVFQILILLSQSVHADTKAIAQSAVEAEVIHPPIPKGWQKPNFMFVPPQDEKFEEAMKVHSAFTDSKGFPIEVEVAHGRFGATFGDKFWQEVFEAELKAGAPIEFILALESTLEAAKIHKQRLAAVGRQTHIIMVPEAEQNKYVEQWNSRAIAKQEGLIKQFWWEVKDKAGLLLHPVKTVSNAKKIISHQFVKPNSLDLKLLKISVATTAATTGLIIGYVGVDPTFATAMAMSRIAIGGTALTFRKTITNLFRADILNDLSTTSIFRQALGRVGVLGNGIAQAYYGIGTALSPTYAVTQAQIVSNIVTTGILDTWASIERDRKLSELASYRMMVYTQIIGTILSTFSVTGNIGHVHHLGSMIEISNHLLISAAIVSSLLISYKYFTDHVEKIAQRSIISRLKERTRKLLTFQQIRKERAEEEARKAELRAKEDALRAERKADLRSRMIQIVEDTRKMGEAHRKPTGANNSCRPYFK